MILVVVVEPRQRLLLSRLRHFSCQGWIHVRTYRLLLLVLLFLRELRDFLLRLHLLLHELFVFVAEVLRREAFLLLAGCLACFLLITLDRVLHRKCRRAADIGLQSVVRIPASAPEPLVFDIALGRDVCLKRLLLAFLVLFARIWLVHAVESFLADRIEVLALLFLLFQLLLLAHGVQLVAGSLR